MKERTHHRLRAFLDEILEARHAGMTSVEAARRMSAKRVPMHLQWRICDR